MTIAPIITEIIITAEEMMATEQYLMFLAELEAATATGARILEAEAAAARALDLAIAFALIGLAAAVIIPELMSQGQTQAETLAEQERVKSQRRRKKTAICSAKALQIIEFAHIKVTKGDYSGRALKTTDHSKRTVRHFKSKA